MTYQNQIRRITLTCCFSHGFGELFCAIFAQLQNKLYKNKNNIWQIFRKFYIKFTTQNAFRKTKHLTKIPLELIQKLPIYKNENTFSDHIADNQPFAIQTQTCL